VTLKRACALLLVVTLVAAVLGYLLVRHEVSRASLSRSVAGYFGGFAGCGRKSARVWQCDVSSQEGSDEWGPYNVTVSGSCWRGALIRSSKYASGPRAISGCIEIADQFRIDPLGLGMDPPPGYY
jgi:hypothetical protein